MRQTSLKRKPMKRKKLRRDWGDAQAKCSAEGKCRGCGLTVKELVRLNRYIQAAHTVGTTYDPAHESPQFDRYVHPDSVIPLCGPSTDTGTCHQLYDARRLDLSARLTGDEIGWAFRRIGERQAWSRIRGRQ